jgi:serine/threonine protein kinase/class 3 adenylate cyclase/tetratricopeptide (TPR) repeat protein
MRVDSTEQRRLATIVFTDIVGSTQLKQELGEREALALIKAHHALIREILHRFPRGEEIETAGDSFFLVFDKPSDAARFALLVQSRLRVFLMNGHSVRDRIGIHVGEVLLDSLGDSQQPQHPSGVHVDTCARVMSLAQGDQILLTRFAFDSARSVLRGEEIEGVGPLSWMNHGSYLLKGVEEPVEIYEVGESGPVCLKAPGDVEKARRQLSPGEEPVLGWRPALDQVVPNTKWVLERKLGEGGFGEVWLGRHEALKEWRVFKFCFRADRVRALKREVTLFRVMKEKIGQHPNIVGIQEVFFDQPPFYIVMNYAEGQDLRAWCEAQGGVEKIPLTTRMEIVAQVADALQAAHAAGVIHRDLKPSNILVSERGAVTAETRAAAQEPHTDRSTPATGSSPNRKSQIANRKFEVKLTDFGIGQVVSQEALAGLTRMGFTQTMVGPGSSSHTGTQMYMAPELLAGQTASVHSDIYSLGVVLYQLLIGDFQQPLTIEWARRIDNPLLREDLERCLAGKPQERFDGAAELGSRLRSLETRMSQRAAEERTAFRRKILRQGITATLILTTFIFLSWYVINRSERGRSKKSGDTEISGPAPAEASSGQFKPTPVSAPEKSVAVMPFENISTNKEADAYLSEGLTDHLITVLSHVPGLRVASHASVKEAKTRFGNLQEFGAFLHVDAVLEGSVQKSGELLRITAQLVRVADDSHLLTTNYDRAMTNLFEIQDDVAQRVAEALKGVLLPEERHRLTRERPPVNLEAYRQYVMGRALFNRFSYNEDAQSLEYFRQALKLDTNYALAYAGMAASSATMGVKSSTGPQGSLTSKEKYLEAKEYALKALELDDSLGEAYSALGIVKMFYEFDWPGAEAKFRKALELEPENVDAHHFYGHYLEAMGRHEEAVASFQRAIDLEPLTQILQVELANVYYHGREFKQAVGQCQKVINANPKAIWAYGILAAADLRLGDPTNALAAISKARSLVAADASGAPDVTGGSFPRDPVADWRGDVVAQEGCALAMLGRKEEVGQRIEEIKSKFGGDPYSLALLYQALGQKDTAIDKLNEAAARRYWFLIFMKVDPSLDLIRTDARFNDVLRKVRMAP